MPERSPLAARSATRATEVGYSIPSLPRSVSGTLALGVGIGFSIAAFLAVRSFERDRIHREFHDAVSERAATIQRQIDSQEWLLKSVVALRTAADSISKEGFIDFVQPLLQRGGGLQALSWVQRVPASERADYEARMRALGHRDFVITERDNRGQLAAATDREEYFPVTFVEPLRGNEAAIGFDLNSHPDRRITLEQACMSGELRSTGPLNLVHDTREARTGFLTAAPAYHRGVQLRDADQRRENLVGYATQVFYIDDLVARGVETLTPGGVDLQIVDPHLPAGEQLLYVHASRTRDAHEAISQADGPVSVAGLRLDQSLWVGGREWTLIGTAAPAFLRSRRGSLAWVLLFGGITASCLGALYLNTTERRAHAIANLNQTLEHEIQERQRAEREQRELQDRVLRSQKLESLGVLAGGVAHDFNNLLTAILGNAELAQVELARDSSARTAVDEIITASHRATALTQQMLAYAGKAYTMRYPIDLNAHLEGILDLLQTAIPKKIRLSVDLGSDLPPFDADPGQIQQLIMNLVLNAAEAYGDGPGSVEITTRPETIQELDTTCGVTGDSIPPGDYVALRVEDHAAGMDAATRSRIFDPFFTTKFQGRGLGLAAALGIVKAHDATVQIESQPGQGSTFTILFPASTQPVFEPPSEMTPDLPWEGGTVLLVDDEPSLRHYADPALQSLGYQTVQATTGQEAIEILKRQGQKICVVILDLTMPDMDGEETLRTMLQLGMDTPTILTSGYSAVGGEIAAVREGHAEFIAKPYTPDALNKKLRAALERPRKRRASNSTSPPPIAGSEP